MCHRTGLLAAAAACGTLLLAGAISLVVVGAGAPWPQSRHFPSAASAANAGGRWAVWPQRTVVDGESAADAHDAERLGIANAASATGRRGQGGGLAPARWAEPRDRWAAAVRQAVVGSLRAGEAWIQQSLPRVKPASARGGGSASALGLSGSPLSAASRSSDRARRRRSALEAGKSAATRRSLESEVGADDGQPVVRENKELLERRQRMKEILEQLENLAEQDTVGARLLGPAPGPPLGEKDQSLASMIDEVLDKEFEDDASMLEGSKNKFNDSIQENKASLETVARVHQHDYKGNATAANATTGGDDLQKLFRLDFSKGDDSEKVERLIDKENNEFVISNPKKAAIELQQDWDLIADIILVIVSAAVMGTVSALLGQPAITGYLLAGSMVGPGGLGLVKELVQVETLAQFGVIFLLFSLGMEFSLQKLRMVRGVAIIGGLLQILLFMCICGAFARMSGAAAAQGIFIGAFLSMSSTAVVLKCIMDRNVASTLAAQITIGSLVLQDVMVGLLFALLPVLGGGGTIAEGAGHILREFLVMFGFLIVAMVLAYTVVPRLLGMLSSLSVQNWELYQMAAIALCLSVAFSSDKLGISVELGSFVAGVMVSSTEFSELTLHQVEPIRNVFSALFLASIGMIMNPAFLWEHLDILLASVLLLIMGKTLVVAAVVKLFGYNLKTALTVGMYMGNVGEFAFVLLSKASNLGLVQRNVYLLLLGTTALSLVSTPVLFRLTPLALRMAVVMRWIPKDEPDLPLLAGESPRIERVSRQAGRGANGADFEEGVEVAKSSSISGWRRSAQGPANNKSHDEG